MKKLFDYKEYLFILFLSIFSILPFFREGFFTMHDDTQVARVYEMGKMLSEGVLPVRWVPDLGYGYGYPIFNFYAPLAYYLGGLFILIGFNALISTKLMMVFGILLSGVTMYLLAKEFWGRIGGGISALLYVYAPYHALNIYVRGDVSEIFSYAFFPLLFWGLWKLYEKLDSKYFLVTGFSYAAIILSHNLSAMMISPFFFGAITVLYILARRREKNKKILLILLTPILGIFLSLFYILPVFAEMDYTDVLSQVGGTADFRNHFVCLPQLWSSPWLYGGTLPGCIDGLSFRMGKLHVVLTGIAFVLGLIFSRKERKYLLFWFAGTLGTFVSLFLLIDYSKFIWEAFVQMSFFQYPWRFLALVSFFSSLVSGYSFIILEKFRVFRGLGVLLVAGISTTILLVTSNKIFAPQTYLQKTSAEYTSEKALKSYASSLSDEYLPPKFIKPTRGTFVTQRFSPLKGDVKISNVSESARKISAKVVAKEQAKIFVHFAYFPFWRMYINGQRSEFGVTSRGLIVTLPPGSYNIDLVYRQTRIEVIANTISFITLIGVGILVYYQRKRAH